MSQLRNVVALDAHLGEFEFLGLEVFLGLLDLGIHRIRDLLILRQLRPEFELCLEHHLTCINQLHPDALILGTQRLYLLLCLCQLLLVELGV